MVLLLWRPLSYSLSVFYFLTLGNVPQIEPGLNHWLSCWLPLKPFMVSSLLLALVGRGGPPQNVQSVGEPCTSTKLDETEFFFHGLIRLTLLVGTENRTDICMCLSSLRGRCHFRALNVWFRVSHSLCWSHIFPPPCPQLCGVLHGKSFCHFPT